MTSLADVIAQGRKQKHIDSADAGIVFLSNVSEDSYTQPYSVVASDVPKFNEKDPDLVKYLEEHGYVVVAGVMQADEIVRAIELFWAFLSEHAGMLPEDPTTWTDENFKKVGSASVGIISGAGFGNSNAQWYIRTRSAVRDAFTNIYREPDLIASFDGGNIFRPWHGDAAFQQLGIALPSACTSSGWFHVDQGPLQRGLCCVQGLVSLTDSTAETGGFCCIPGSHHSHDELMKLARDDRNYFQLPGTCPQLRWPQILPLCKAGDMILWDSRTVHCSTPALTAPTSPVHRLLRMASYQCMTPRRWASESVTAARIAAYENNITTTHWPHLATYTLKTPVASNSLKSETGSVLSGRRFADAADEVRALV